MGSEGRRSLPDLSAELGARPGRFDFAQAVRAAEDASPALAPVGEDDSPADEAVRFTVARSLVFAAAPLRATRRAESGQHEFETTFLGLTGPSGVLPQHYTELAIQRTQRRDPALASFLDLLHHRTLSLFARASAKYRVALSHERAWRRRAGPDPFERALRCLAGRNSTGGSAPQERAWTAWASTFSRSSRSAAALEQLLTAFLGLEVHVVPFVGRWVEIPASERSRLPTRANPGGSNAALGGGAVLGRRYWDVASRIRVELGPMTRERFLELRPDGPLFADLRALLAEYCDGRLDFDVALTLEQGANLDTQLSRSGAVEPRLGWNTRLSARGPDQAQRRVLFSLASS